MKTSAIRQTAELGSDRADGRAGVLAIALLGAVALVACNRDSGLSYQPGQTDAAGVGTGRPDSNPLTETERNEPDAPGDLPPPGAVGGAGGTFGNTGGVFSGTGGAFASTGGIRGSGGIGGPGGGAVGTATPPVGTVTVDKATLAFGSVEVGSTSGSQTVTVTVKVAAAPINATIAGAGFAISASTCAGTQPVGTCTISVNFAPTAVAGANGVLTVGYNTIPLTGIGTQLGTFSATTDIPLGTLLVNALASAVVQIVPGPSVVSLDCFASGPDLTLASQTCPATGAITAPCSFTFSFKAATPGTKSDLVVCSGGGKTTQTTVTATVVAPPMLAISPTAATFAATKVGEASSYTFNVANTGGSPTGTLAATISTGTPDFGIASNDCGAALPALGVCKIQVTFKPSTVGSKNGTLKVADATPGTPLATSTLSGTAIESNDAGTATVPSFATDIVPLLKKACLCHVQGGQTPLLDTYANVKANAGPSLRAIGAGTMPPGSGLATSDQTLFQAWVNAGAPNN